MMLDLVGGLVLCPHCNEYTKPKYLHDSASYCFCGLCLQAIRSAEVRRKYEKGYRWCARCGTFRQSWIKRKGWCEDCHSKLRARSYTKHAKKVRDLTIKRY